MSNILVIGDTHWGHKNDSDVFSEYFLNFFNATIFPYIEEHGITDVIQTGDLMDKRKNINYQTLNIVTNSFINRFKELNCALHIIPGNHDIYFRHSNIINSMSELFSWCDHVKIYNDPTTVNIGGSNIDFIPWMNPQNTKEIIDFIDHSVSPFCVGHFEINDFADHIGMEIFPNGTPVSLFSRYNCVLSGHYHGKVQHKNITYVGTPYQLTWNDFGETKGCHTFDTESSELVAIPNPISMYIKDFYSSDIDYSTVDFSYFGGKIIKVIVSEKEDIDKFEWYLSEMTKSKPVDLSIVESDAVVVEGIDVEKFEALDTFSILIKLSLENAKNTNLDCVKMNTLVREMYSEALDQVREADC
ncbi:MAG: metallophosphoesterase [Ghiorsea sp.]